LAETFHIPVALTVNAPHYSREQYPLVIELAERAADLGVKAIILGDIGLLLSLLEKKIALELHLSSVGSCLNSEALRFYRELGVRRVILPRGLSLQEIGRLCRQRQGKEGPELEAFVLNDGCVFEEGLCQTSHNQGTFCQTEWLHRFFPTENESKLFRQEETRLQEHLRDYRRWSWYLGGCGPSLSPRGIPNGPCGLCAVADLMAFGVNALKIAGRQAPPLRKLASLQLLHATVEPARRGNSREEIRKAAQAFRDTPELCNANYMCYYRSSQEDSTHSLDEKLS
jgi:putative protease